MKWQWLALQCGTPGHRFVDRYRAAQQSVKKISRGPRLFRLLLAFVAFVIGLILVFIPGPAIVFFFIAGGLLAPESLPLARSMDWCEVHVRKIITWAQRHWRKASPALKAAIVAVALTGAVASAYASYRMFLG